MYFVSKQQASCLMKLYDPDLPFLFSTSVSHFGKIIIFKRKNPSPLRRGRLDWLRLKVWILQNLTQIYVYQQGHQKMYFCFVEEAYWIRLNGLHTIRIFLKLDGTAFKIMSKFYNLKKDVNICNHIRFQKTIFVNIFIFFFCFFLYSMQVIDSYIIITTFTLFQEI